METARDRLPLMEEEWGITEGFGGPQEHDVDITDERADVRDGGCIVTLAQVLETVDEFGTASRGLVAWEFALDGSELAEVWDQAVGEGLLRPVADRDDAGEQMYVLAAPGHSPMRASARRCRD